MFIEGRVTTEMTFKKVMCKISFSNKKSKQFNYQPASPFASQLTRALQPVSERVHIGTYRKLNLQNQSKSSNGSY